MAVPAGVTFPCVCVMLQRRCYNIHISGGFRDDSGGENCDDGASSVTVS